MAFDEREREVGLAALEVLTKQFKNRFDFLRELVQNALDAGTPEVDVWMSFKTTGGGRGVCEIHVDDFGDGMNEHIIDNELTGLFSSTKEDDYTKIGRFGIGFVSVFAIEPDGVLVHTSRGGENWEVFFHNDGTFEKTTVLEPVDGTKITVFKSMSRREYQGSVVSVLETLKFWCKHAEKMIYFRDATSGGGGDEAIDHPFNAGGPADARKMINEPLKVSGFSSLETEKEGTQVAMAFSKTPFYGFYNKGLTLCESGAAEVISGYEKFFSLVSFKIKSHYLEHTLTRDTILRDNNYSKAIGILIETARGPLVEKLLLGLEERARRKDISGEDLPRYREGLSWLYALPRELDPTFRFSEKMLDVRDNVERTLLLLQRKKPSQKSIDADEMRLFRRCNGRSCTLGGVRKAAKKNGNMIYLSPEENGLTEKMKEEGLYVFISPDMTDEASAFFDESSIDSGARSFFLSHIPDLYDHEEETGEPAVCNVELYFRLVEREPPGALSKEEAAFVKTLEWVLKRIDFPFMELHSARFSHFKAGGGMMSCFIGHNSMLGSELKSFRKAKKRDLVLDRLNGSYRMLVDFYGRAPRLALQLAVERIMLETALGLEDYQRAVREIYTL